MSIPFSFHEVVDSTSSLASRMLKEGPTCHALPFAVGAGRQTAGRGRMGREWQSPPGNIYLTVALPGTDIPLQDVTKAPLLVGHVAAQWLETRFGFRPTLKWPNDILFRGRKLGGILCESVVVGDKLKSVLVGIGINLHASSEKPEHAISVEECAGTGHGVDVAACAADLAQSISDAWNPRELENAVSLFKRYSFPDGTLWVDRAGDPSKTSVQERITSAGGLLLRSKTGTVQEVVSADHNYVWYYQSEARTGTPIIVGDVGNSRLKLAVFASPRAKEEPVKTWTVPHGEAGPAEMRSIVEELRTQVSILGFPIYFLSVRPDAFARVSEVIADSGFNAIDVGKRGVRIVQSQYDPKQLGADRVGIMEGVAGKYGVNTFIAVSCGTAVTADVVLEGDHVGGYILAGMQTKLDALAAKTGLLPQTNLHSRGGYVMSGAPQTTEAAMMSGAVRETASFVNSLRQEFQDEMRQIIPVYLTGGDAAYLRPFISGAVWDDCLVLEGCRAMALGGV